MSKLGKFLERFYGAQPTFETVYARVRHTRMVSPRSSREPPIGRARPNAASPVERELQEAEITLWVAPPDRARLEETCTQDGKSQTRLEIVNGDDAWTRHADGTVEHDTKRRRHSRESANLPTEYRRHFDRLLLRECFAALTMEADGTCRVADRECLRIRAAHIPGTQLWPHWFSFEASEFELAADIEHAVLLSIVGTVDGQAVDTHEVLELVFDAKIEADRFAYTPTATDNVIPAIPVVEHISLEAAVTRAPFTVLQPKNAPESGRLESHVVFHPARPRDSGEHLSIMYLGGETFDHLWINQRSAPNTEMREDLQWDKVERDGRCFEISDPDSDEGRRVVVFEQNGTHVEIISDLPSDKLLDIAASMVPVA